MRALGRPGDERVRGVGIETETRKETCNEKEFEYQVFLVTLCWQNDFDREKATKLGEYGDRTDTEALAGWLRDKLGLPLDAPPQAASA